MNQTVKYIFFFALFLLQSCESENSSPITEITSELLEGKWVLDSVNVQDVSRSEQLFFTEGKMYRCSYWRNGYFIDSAEYIDSKVDSYSDRVYELQLLDSTKLLIRSRVEYYYKKVREDDLSNAINQFRIGDSLRKHYIGYWKPVNTPEKPLKIMNHSPACESISFEIFNNGTCNFYLNQKLDSVVNHSFRLRGNSPQFSNGCLVGDYDITWDSSKTKLGLVFSRFYPDTVWFEKECR